MFLERKHMLFKISKFRLNGECIKYYELSGTTYMVVDCGGGTVDITVHEIMDKDGNMKEINKASGDACGSIGKWMS